jgi:hypothetical protein
MLFLTSILISFHQQGHRDLAADQLSFPSLEDLDDIVTYLAAVNFTFLSQFNFP